MESVLDKEVPKTEEEIAYEQMNAALQDIQKQRDELAKSLLETAKTTKLNPQEDSPRVTEVKLALFKTADDLLKSQESLHINKVKVGLQKKDTASNENVKQMAIEVLKNIDLSRKINAPVSSVDNQDDILKKAFEASLKENPDTAIKDDELKTE